MKQLHVLMFGAVLPALLAVGCATNPVTGNPNFVVMTEAQEISTGRSADAEVRKQYYVYDVQELQDYVNQVGQKLAHNSHRPNLSYHFTVLDSTEVNAFALPGGYIYITRGIVSYLNSEAELGAVLGHETGHVTARHSVQQISAATAANVGVQLASVFLPGLNSMGGSTLTNLLGNVLLSGYGREHELEADRLGAEYLGRAGYDPQAMVKVIGVLKNQELFDAEVAKQEGREPRAYHGLFATHPDNDTRLQQVVTEAQSVTRPDAVVNRDAFLKHIDGMIFGDSPQQGIVRNGSFYHGELGLALKFPEGWRIHNLPDRVQAQSPGNDAGVELRLGENKPEGTPADYLRKLLRLTFGVEIQSLTLNGFPAATAVLSSQGKPVRVTVIYFNNHAFLIVGSAASKSAFERYQENFNTTASSFHAITDAERRLAKPLKIKIINAREGLTYAELAKNSPLGKNAENHLRLFNAQYPSGEPLRGQALKIVE
ncbi:MAG TPA: M48 family metalloprotease [Burkholderiales bacterium]|nr:M48 family metalloprotease [Burkholderiales bacterium]